MFAYEECMNCIDSHDSASPFPTGGDLRAMRFTEGNERSGPQGRVDLLKASKSHSIKANRQEPHRLHESGLRLSPTTHGDILRRATGSYSHSFAKRGENGTR